MAKNSDLRLCFPRVEGLSQDVDDSIASYKGYCLES